MSCEENPTLLIEPRAIQLLPTLNGDLGVRDSPDEVTFNGEYREFVRLMAKEAGRPTIHAGHIRN